MLTRSPPIEKQPPRVVKRSPSPIGASLSFILCSLATVLMSHKRGPRKATLHPAPLIERNDENSHSDDLLEFAFDARVLSEASEAREAREAREVPHGVVASSDEFQEVPAVDAAQEMPIPYEVIFSEKCLLSSR